MYALHPATVHFPIALLLANGLLTLLYLRGKGQAFEISAYHCLVLGWLGSVLATLSGAWDAWRQVYGPQTPADPGVLNWVNAHALVGLALVIIYGQALLLRRRYPNVLADTQRRRGYLWRLGVGTLLVLLNGWIGGYLVYNLGLGGAP